MAQARFTLLSLAAFGACIAASALAYPGGTWENRHSQGFSFWHNFWCDLLAQRSLSGADNGSAKMLARLAFGCFAVALWSFWPALVQRLGPAHGTTVKRAGRLGTYALALVALVPAADSQLLHGVAVLAAAGASSCALGAVLPALAQRGRKLALTLALLALATAGVCLAQYVYQGVWSHQAASWLAGMQKVATALFLAFMVSMLVERLPPRDAP